jgi:hypothetical protein
LPGGWLPFQPFTPHDKQVFEEAVQGFIEVKDAPQAASTQVAGTNYRHECRAIVRLPAPSGEQWQRFCALA